jgi:hypothetical protein
MKHLILTLMAMCAQASLGLALTQFDGAESSEGGPSMPGGNGSEWAGPPEGPKAWVVRTKNARGPTGHCDDPNPRPDKQPQGILMTGEPNGPMGPDWTYWVSLTEDHYAGPEHGMG